MGRCGGVVEAVAGDIRGSPSVNLFISPDEIEEIVDEIKDALFHFDTNNAEIFSQQISQINDRKQMLEVTKALNNAKSLYNLIRLSKKIYFVITATVSSVEQSSVINNSQFVYV